jgi:hypothetical protein
MIPLFRRLLQVANELCDKNGAHAAYKSVRSGSCRSGRVPVKLFAERIRLVTLELEALQVTPNHLGGEHGSLVEFQPALFIQ